MNFIKQKQKKDLLTHKQLEINYRQKEHTIDTNIWLQRQGISTSSLTSTHPQLLKAQQAAHQLLTHHSDLLNNEQRLTLEQFRHKMNNKRTRQKLKPEAAYPILNINTKISRHLFKLHRTLA